MSFVKIIHNNRDENSFTARLFENILFPRWYANNDDFQEFVEILKTSSKLNQEIIRKNPKFENTKIGSWEFRDKLYFLDGMLFLELYDVDAYCKKNYGITINNSDKTELDCVIICKDEDNNEHLIVFEVKCYTDLVREEIERQHARLRTFMQNNLFYDFHHFALISHDNLINANKIFRGDYLKDIENGLYLVTWDNIKRYLIPPRFSEVDLKLHKSINRNNDGLTRRSLIDRERTSC